MMKIKPILQIQGEKLDTFSKSRTLSKATKIMIEAIQKDIEERLDPIEKVGTSELVESLINKVTPVSPKNDIF